MRHRSPPRKNRPARPTPPAVLERVRIDSLAYGGRGVARSGPHTVTVAGTAPGDVVTCRPLPDARHGEADLVELHAPGPDRRPPPCPYWQACGSCQLMHLTDAAQLSAKHAFVAEALARALGPLLPAAGVAPVRPAPASAGYRRRTTVRGAFADGQVEMGLVRHGTQELVDLPACMILHPALDQALTRVRKRVAELPPDPGGEFRVEAACDAEGRIGLVLTAPAGLCDAFTAVGDALIADGVSAVRLVDETDRTWLEEGDPRQFVLRTAASPSGPCRFSLASFTQLNFEQNDALVTHVVDRVRAASPARVLDLYAGIGNYSLALARHVPEVLSVESSLSAVADLRNNALEQSLANVRCVRGASSQVVRELAKRRERFDAVVLNPTRAGADGVVQPLPQLSARRLVYVSCSPPTLARDLAVLAKAGYRVTEVTPFDMFPQTYHVETVAVLERS